MDTVDIITMATTAAQLIRSSGKPDEVLASSYALLGLTEVETSDAWSLRVVRLMELAGERRREVLNHLTEHSGPLPGNRTFRYDVSLQNAAAPEAIRLLDVVNGEVAEFVDLLESPPWYKIAERKITLSYNSEDAETPTMRVRCLLDYPIDVPIVFEIDLDAISWDYASICGAISDAYIAIYEKPERYGVSMHDITDLVIEGLHYYPGEKLIYPVIGS